MTLFKNKYRIESSRLPGYDYSSPGLYFVTICTRDRCCFFGDVLNAAMDLSPIGEIVADEWQKTPQIRTNVQLDEWIVMPNHVHGIIWITHTAQTTRREKTQRDTTQRDTTQRVVSTEARFRANTLGSIIGQIKSVCTKRIHAAGCANFDWQERYYDEIIRNERALNAVRAYIVDNPASWETDKHNPAGLRM